MQNLSQSKYYSAEYTDGTYQTGTSTSYIWAGDTLVAYIERPIASGSPSGTAKTYYVHPDHLESTSAVTNESGDVVLEKDYLPYGSTRVETGTTDSNRGFIAQFENEGNDLSYLNARYYDGGRGQFTSQDPVFWEIGKTEDGKKILTAPQAQNSYGYAGGNPITNKDPSGRIAQALALVAVAPEIVIPAIVVGGVAIGSYYLTEAVLNRVDTTRFVGPRQTLDFSKYGVEQTPMGPEDMLPNLNPKLPKWVIATIGGLVTGTIIHDIREQFISTVDQFKSNRQKDSTVLTNITSSTGPTFNVSEVKRFVENYKRITGQKNNSK